MSHTTHRFVFLFLMSRTHDETDLLESKTKKGLKLKTLMKENRKKKKKKTCLIEGKTQSKTFMFCERKTLMNCKTSSHTTVCSIKREPYFRGPKRRSDEREKIKEGISHKKSSHITQNSKISHTHSDKRRNTNKRNPKRWNGIYMNCVKYNLKKKRLG